MEEAARQATDRLLKLYPQQSSFLILAGPGNNGGDGLAMARMLHLAGKEVWVLCSHPTEKYKGDAQINFQILSHLPVRIMPFSKDLALDLLGYQPILIDALLGTGIQSDLRTPVSDILDFFREQEVTTVAVDLPSGLNADTGMLINRPLQATHTLTFQLPKICHLVSPASEFCGEIHVLDIGIWPSVLAQMGIQRAWLQEGSIPQLYRKRPLLSHKGSFGHVLIVGGSRFMSGAIAMASLAAVEAGVGLCTTFTPAPCRQTVLETCPEAMCIDVPGDYLSEEAIERFREVLKGKTAVVLGPGLGLTSATTAFLKATLPEIKVPLLLDADALNILAENPELILPSDTVLTPHPGEMARLLPAQNPEEARLEAAEMLANKLGICLVLKGKGTLISNQDGETWINSTGNPGLASGGTGDVLAGAIGAFLAMGYKPMTASKIGVFLHGKAADLLREEIGEEGIKATRVAANLSLALKNSLESNS
jgi:NAD(P)H-hydrate epimerase